MNAFAVDRMSHLVFHAWLLCFTLQTRIIVLTCEVMTSDVNINCPSHCSWKFGIYSI